MPSAIQDEFEVPEKQHDLLECKEQTVTCALGASLSLGYKGFLSSTDPSDFDILTSGYTPGDD